MPIGFHYQGNVDNWPEAVAKLPPGTPYKVVDGIQRCTEAKAVNPDVYTIVRHHVFEQNPSGDYHEHARKYFASFVDDSFRRDAWAIDAVSEFNEYFADSQDDDERARWVRWVQAVVDVWRDEYRTQRDYEHIDLVLCDTAVGNNIPLAVAKIAHANPFCVLSYHTYWPVWNKQLHPEGWEWYAGRFESMDMVYRYNGAVVRWAFLEWGAVGINGEPDPDGIWPNSLAANDGWRHPDVFDGSLPHYLDLMTEWCSRLEDTQAWQDGRVIGATIFTSGGGSLWKHFEVKQPEMSLIAQHVKTLSESMTEPGEPPEPPPPEPPEPIPDIVLGNPSFEEGWTDISMTAQVPDEWLLDIAEIGVDEVRGKKVTGTPECVHKHQDQLPPNEQPGAADALILDGEYCYKLFTTATWAAQLSQRVMKLEAGSRVRFTIPVQVHFDGRPDGYDLEDTLVEAGIEDKLTALWMTKSIDRTWQYLTIESTVPDDGIIDLWFKVSVKWEHPTSVFIDALKLEVIDAEPEPPTGDCTPRVDYSRTMHVLPQDAKLEHAIDVVISTYADRETVGFSYDDAGLGAGVLKENNAVLWGIPEAEREAYVEFYDSFYPQTVISFRDFAPLSTAPGIIVDVSSHQGEIDWQQMADAGVTHAYIRATIGVDRVDEQFHRNVVEAAKNGIRWGGYHYFLMHQSGAGQASNFTNTNNYLCDLPPALDIEGTLQSAPPAPEQWRIWLDMVESPRHGKPVVYTSAGYWNRVPAQEWASKYRLWVANWSNAAQPTIPNDWNTWWLWQYGQDFGAGYGVESKEIDLNRFNDDSTESTRFSIN